MQKKQDSVKPSDEQVSDVPANANIDTVPAKTGSYNLRTYIRTSELYTRAGTNIYVFLITKYFEQKQTNVKLSLIQ